MRPFFHPTEADLALYARLARSLRVLPPSSLFRHLGTEGQHLALLGDRAPWIWARVMRRARGRWPDLPTDGRVAGDGTVLNSVPERIVYEAVRPIVPTDMALDHEPPLGGAPPWHFADFALRHGARVVHVEVVGACGRDRVTRNALEVRLLAEFDRRLEHYRRCRLPAPEAWFLDDLVDPDHLRQRFLAIAGHLRAGGGA
ncbi:hypothetical protein [Gluconacetobacter sacchari]|uniref:hypothetical protein n=1 Tax=Gluconacetobacter sacchari TaxID=92759 RepID=UPI00278C8213|nr:hypothetical protein [Gluconacetobacter sacchari]